MNGVETREEAPVTRRNLLRMTAMAAIVGGVGGLGGAGTAAAATTARSYTDGAGNVFLGGDFLELGIRPDGGFGASNNAPASFYGSERGNIGMFGNFLGFGTPVEGKAGYDYFLPGTPEERFSVGYYDPNTGTEYTATNGRDVTNAPAGTDQQNIPTTVTDLTPTTPADTLAASVVSTFDTTDVEEPRRALEIAQVYTFARTAKFFDIEVTLTNVGDTTLDSVRYQRSVDPDNGVDLGRDYTTKNTIVSQQPADGSAVVTAEIADFDSSVEGSTIPMFYRSTDSRARVSYGTGGTYLHPDPVVYDPYNYDDVVAVGLTQGETNTDDRYIAITYDVGSLAPGASTTLRMNTGLTNDVDETIDEADGSPPEVEPQPRRSARFRVVESSVSPERVVIGEEVTATATVRNVGEIRGKYLALFQDDVRLFDTKEAVIEPDEEHTFEFTVTYNRIGTNRLFVRSWNIGTVRVRRPQRRVLGADELEIVDASLSRSTAAPGDRYEVEATVRNVGDAEGDAPLTFVGVPVGLPEGKVIERRRRVRLAPDETATVVYEARIAPRRSQSFRRTWTVNGIEAGTVTVDLSAGGGDGSGSGSGSGGSGSGSGSDEESAGGTGGRDGVIEARISPRTVGPGEEYEVIGVVRNGRSETNTYTVAFHQGGTARDIVMVRLAPGETEEVSSTMTAPDEPGRSREWFVSDRSAGHVTVLK